jgi:hypothetical protein
MLRDVLVFATTHTYRCSQVNTVTTNTREYELKCRV